MTKYFLLFVMILTTLFLATCSIEGEYVVDPGGDDDEISISGSLFMPVPFGLSLTPTSGNTIDNLTGDVLVTVGDKEFTVPSEEITLNNDNDTIRVPLSVSVDFSGIVVITCMSRLTVGEEPIKYAGYLITKISKGEELDLNAIDLDGDGFVSTAEKEGTQFTPAVMSSSGASDDPANIQLFSLNNYNMATTSPVVTFDAQIENLDWNLVYLGITDGDDNTQYRMIEIDDEALESHYIDIDSDNQIDGKPDNRCNIALNQGSNKICLFVVNSQGLTASKEESIVCQTEFADGEENFLFTLTWDNLGDLDLHTWYFIDEDHTSPEETLWHSDWFYPKTPDERIDGEDSEDLINLDIDNKTGFGPEHFTLVGAADGYYVIAVNAFELITNTPINAYVTLESNSILKSYGPERFTEADAAGGLSNPNALIRIADIKVTDGEAEFRDPDLFIELTDFPGEADSRIGNAKTPGTPRRN